MFLTGSLYSSAFLIPCYHGHKDVTIGVLCLQGGNVKYYDLKDWRSGQKAVDYTLLSMIGIKKEYWHNQ